MLCQAAYPVAEHVAEESMERIILYHNPGRDCASAGKARRAAHLNQATLRTLPLRRHRVHTRIRRTPPPTSARTSCRFGCHRRLVLLFAWLTLLPTELCLPQIVQCRMAW